MFPLCISFTNSLRHLPVQGYNARKNTYKRYSQDTSDLIVEQCHEGQEDSDRSQTRHSITPRKKVDKSSLMYRDSICFDWIGSVCTPIYSKMGKNYTLRLISNYLPLGGTLKRLWLITQRFSYLTVGPSNLVCIKY